MEKKIDKFIRIATYLDQSPLVWSSIFVGLICLAFAVGKEDKLAGDLLLILAGNVSSRIRSKKT